MSQYGTAIPISIFGESHGESIGLTIHNLPAGITINHTIIKDALTKRRPKSKISTARQEKDQYRIISGVLENKTTGAPLTVIVPNKDTHSKDYDKYILRPSHSDYTAHMKYRSLHDHRGGGHFSGRITATLVILGAICQQILTKKDILIGSHIVSIKNQSDDVFTLETLNKETLLKLLNSDFPLLNTNNEGLFKEEITKAKDQNDSVGGVIETAVLNMPVGLGGPYFNKFESFLSGLIFSLPAVKGLAFGDGFDITTKYGSEANDPFTIQNGKIVTTSNHSGGVQGGITNGMPLTFSTAIKPTSSIGKPQKTVNFKTKEEIEYTLVGRHDPAIVHRVVHVINAITNYAMVEAITKEEGYKWMI